MRREVENVSLIRIQIFSYVSFSELARRLGNQQRLSDFNVYSCLFHPSPELTLYAHIVGPLCLSTLLLLILVAFVLCLYIYISNVV